LQRRAEFMKKQRDLLNEKKRLERERQLDTFMKESKKSGEPSRPMSSRLARSVIAGEPNGPNMSDDEKKKLEARLALAEILKKEVINKK
jgi:hypothetical protein